VGESPADDELFHILYDGTVMDEEGFSVLGGQSDQVAEALGAQYQAPPERAAAVKLGAAVLAAPDQPPLGAGALEVALLDRARTRRAFQRVRGAELEALLAT
jgi:proteasome alpha subunit